MSNQPGAVKYRVIAGVGGALATGAAALAALGPLGIEAVLFCFCIT